MGLILSTLQVYCDFAGYSNIAIGISKLFGIRLMRNFATPFFSTNISDFWNRWHISLSSWMLDYLFTPLSFLLRAYKKPGLILAIMITFIVVGFWHGANWTFIVFGVLNGIYFIPLIVRGKAIKSSLGSTEKVFPSIKELLQMVGLFLLLSISIIFFWVDSLSNAIVYLSNVFTASLFDMPDFKSIIYVIPPMILFFIIEWLTRDKEYALKVISSRSPIRWSVYLLLGFIVFLAIDNNPNAFIYLQF
jgi:D-alanyl-lipoteichoic acid acyltransferase DltB (MBOAT superfamily)